MTSCRFFNPLKFVIVITLTLLAASPSRAQFREWRGAWVSTVYQDYAKRTTAKNKKYLSALLDSLQKCRCNVVVFQVRPKADAFYKSDLEPWSSWLTGTSGTPPDEDWDPLEFMIKESHRRGMELHAWINPYRVDTGSNGPLPQSYYAKQHPDRVVKFGGAHILNPGIPENQDYVVEIICDIVSRYDIDGLHMDDYFYPYPNKKLSFNDKAAYAAYGNGKDLGDWRRDNTAALIKKAGEAIHSLKPWVRFGISPFGIWRNKTSDPEGSETAGTQCYDDLFADPVQWIREGWIDYLVPQLYWGLNKKIASARTLTDWWSKQGFGRHVYIGQDVKVTMDSCELAEKMMLSRTTEGIQGNCWWPAYELLRDYKQCATTLADYWQMNYAIPPAYPWLSQHTPGEVGNLQCRHFKGSSILSWTAPKAAKPIEEARFYVVYIIPDGQKPDLSNSAYIAGVTSECSYVLPPLSHGRYVAYIAVLDRCNNLSRHPARISL